MGGGTCRAMCSAQSPDGGDKCKARGLDGGAQGPSCHCGVGWRRSRTTRPFFGLHRSASQRRSRMARHYRMMCGSWRTASHPTVLMSGRQDGVRDEGNAESKRGPGEGATRRCTYGRLRAGCEEAARPGWLSTAPLGVADSVGRRCAIAAR